MLHFYYLLNSTILLQISRFHKFAVLAQACVHVMEMSLLIPVLGLNFSHFTSGMMIPQDIHLYDKYNNDDTKDEIQRKLVL